jgi:hypothetical protein
MNHSLWEEGKRSGEHWAAESAPLAELETIQ